MIYLLVVDRRGRVRTTNEAVSSDVAYARRYKRSGRMQMSPCVLLKDQSSHLKLKHTKVD